MRHLMLLTLVTAVLGGRSSSAFTFDDISYWIGAGPNRSALVVDWGEADPRPPLAWGYRFEGMVSSETMLRALARADRNLYVRLGSNGPFGVPLYGIGYDQNESGFALTDGTTFDHGVAVTGPSDGATAIDPQDRYAEGWYDGNWALFNATDDPYGTGQWELAGTGISGRMLSDGVWDGLSFATALPIVPRVPVPATRHPSLHVNLAPETIPVGPQVVPEPHFGWLVWMIGLFLIVTRPPHGTALLVCLVGCVALLGGRSDCRANGFAATVIRYDPGAGVGAGFDDPTAALGGPTRFTSPAGPFGGPVTPFNAPFGTEELVTVGFGGSLTLGFDQPVFDRNRLEEFGFDFIVFGNAFFFDGDFPNGVVAGIGEEPGTIEVSQDGIQWFAVSAMADTAFPTMGYQDITDAFPTAAGNVPTNFQKPVDPSLDPMGMTMPDLIAAYAGSGGGTGVNIASTGLEWMQYVRISNNHDPSSTLTPEIDAISVIPEPSGLALLVWVVVGWELVRIRRGAV